MSVNAKDKALCLVPSNEVSQHLQDIAINRESPYPAVFFFLSYCLFDVMSADWAESMSFAQPRPAPWTVRADASFEVQDGYGAGIEVNILYSQCQGFRNTAAQPRQEPY